MEKLMKYKVPCIVYCRDIEVPQEVLDVATKHGIPVLGTKKTTSDFMAEVIRWLNVELAQRITIHGVLVDVYGEGSSIGGGIGQSRLLMLLLGKSHIAEVQASSWEEKTEKELKLLKTL